MDLIINEFDVTYWYLHVVIACDQDYKMELNMLNQLLMGVLLIVSY